MRKPKDILQAEILGIVLIGKGSIKEKMQYFKNIFLKQF